MIEILSGRKRIPTSVYNLNFIVFLYDLMTRTSSKSFVLFNLVSPGMEKTFHIFAFRIYYSYLSTFKFITEAELIGVDTHNDTN